MIKHNSITVVILKSSIKQRQINFAGNERLKIYGTLSCKSGKRMNVENRVFFTSEKEAIENGYRPCGHCMKKQYKNCKDGSIL